MKNLPQINKTYNYFDDGKIKESRMLSVTIIDIIPFDKIDTHTLSLWKEDVESCHWLYAKDTDYFIKGLLNISKEKSEEVFFVRTIDNRWFSIGDWGGLLDIDNKLIRMMMDNLRGTI